MSVEDRNPSPHFGEGFVSLVGAGPGAKDHLTLRALQRLQEADIILYDALVDRSLLDLNPKAKRLYVGKRAGYHAVRQDTIQALMVRYARRGVRVVRLKAGDPFILGRGGEEALALEKAGVAYEVVPGLSSATAAPAFAGVPLTHRGLATGYLTLSGHDPAAFTEALRSLPPQGFTVVALMAFKSRRKVADTLIEAQWPPTTEACLVAGAGQPGQKVWYGALAELGLEGFEASGMPVTLIIGQTISLAQTIARPSPSGRPIPMHGDDDSKAARGLSR